MRVKKSYQSKLFRSLHRFAVPTKKHLKVSVWSGSENKSEQLEKLRGVKSLSPMSPCLVGIATEWPLRDAKPTRLRSSSSQSIGFLNNSFIAVFRRFRYFR